MSRNNRRVSGGSNMASSLVAVERILSKEREYRDGVDQNHAACKVLAEMISIQGELETSMLQAATDPALKQEIEASLQEQRERIKKISEKNVQSGRKVDSFIGALQAVRNQVQNTNEDAAEPPDYEQIITAKMEQHSAAQAASQLDLRDEQMCREIREKLGEKEQRAARAGGDDSDDELEVMRNPIGTESLMCPVTASLFQDPVRNKVCGHVYSNAGIEHLMRSKPRVACPVAGCRNKNVTRDQLEEDKETALKVRRHKRRQEAERAQRASQAILGDDSDEEM